HQTLWIAASVNLLVALSAFVGSCVWEAVPPPAHSTVPPSQVTRQPAGSARISWLALGCAALTGAAGMGYEVAWTRVLGILTSNSAYGFALVLTIFLLGLGIGSLVQGYWPLRSADC